MARKGLTGADIEFCRDEIQSGSITKVLWSRDTKESFSNRGFNVDVKEGLPETDRTASSCSWGFDEYEIKSTKRIKSSLNAIEKALYDGTNDPLLSHELHQECQKWSQKFKYLRLQGQEILPASVDEPVFRKQSDPEDETAPASMHGLEAPSEKYSSPEFNSTDTVVSKAFVYSDVVTEDIGETIAEDGNCDANVEKSSNQKFVPVTETNKGNRNAFSEDYIQEKVIDQLASYIWSEVLFKWGKSSESESSNSESNDCLPPITNSKESNCPSTFQRPWTQGKTPKTSDFPKLDGILTISPKVLQKRSESRIGSSTERRTRPNTGISVMSYSSIGSFRSPNLPKPTVKSREKPENHAFSILSTPKRPLEKEVDVLNPYLPVLEENCPMLHNRLLSNFEIKDSLSKLKFPDASSFPVKPSFLPPIDDRETNSIISNQDFQRPISYESHLPGSKKQNHSNMYTRHLNRISARPSTTRTSWDMRNPSFDVKKHKDISPVGSQSLLSVNRKKIPIENVDNLVTLFPIVTSLEPRHLNDRYKNQNFTKKNSLLSAFHQRDKR